MSTLQTFKVNPIIPDSLQFLEVLARNLWWVWQPDARDLFRRVDPGAWRKTRSNPVAFLDLAAPERLQKLAGDVSYLAHLERVRQRFEQHMTLEAAGREAIPLAPNETIAYLSMEFGLHESLPMFAGGLGVLAGDHLKAASSLRVPLTGIGLLYSQGYFNQYLDAEGWQQEAYPEIDLYRLPVERAQDAAGNDLRISVPGPEGPIHADVWKLMVGTVPLYLLDANILQNPPHVREITSRLYMADEKIRLSQEILLGIGGIRALARMDLLPKIVHMNEGHSAFCNLERLHLAMRTHNVNLKTALEIVPRTTVFTTHTPVAAGHDEFPVDLVKPVLTHYAERLGVPPETILGWGQPDGSPADGPLCMFVLGLRMAQHCNGVSALHGRVARRMWSHVWPQRPEAEIPIAHITNGVHVPTMLSDEFALLFDRYLGPDWQDVPDTPDTVARVDDISSEELWRAHELNRARLVRTCREYLSRQYRRRNAPQATIRDAENVLDPEALTIGFARRFATYKRGTLLLRDPRRLEAILADNGRPVQFIFAGKAHPRDQEGKQIIQQLVRFARQDHVRHRIVFIENYDMFLARRLVQGCDVWLNTPRRPFEACGTSGMKAAVNGVLNVSILDGWWAEGFDRSLGWAIGNGDEYADLAYQDSVESQAVYNVLENDVLPTFYNRSNGNAPGAWIAMMRASIKLILSRFSSLRMLRTYRDRFYVPAIHRHDELTADDAREGTAIAAQLKRLKQHWEKVRIEAPVRQRWGHLRVGDEMDITARVHLGELRPEEVVVELYYGPLRSVTDLADSRTQAMTLRDDLGGGDFQYTCRVQPETAGRYGFTARLVPAGDDRLRWTPFLLKWA